MSEDRLESTPSNHPVVHSLKGVCEAWRNHGFGIEGSPNHLAVGWLISEAELERKAADTVRLGNRELLRILDARDATIAMLRGRLRKLQTNTAMKCSRCGGYSLSLADGAKDCECRPVQENEKETP